MKKLTGTAVLLGLGICLACFTGWKNEPAAATAGSSKITNAVGLNLGNEAPEIVLKNPAGGTVKLSQLRGKVVLIDFWASWCGPCRHENPAVVAAYTKFKDKKMKGSSGFTVFSVSLDMDAAAWKRAIEKDALTWEWHGSELMGWNSPVAALYNVTSIPTNYVVNEKGIIINKNLRGEDLINYLDKLAQAK